MVMVTSGGEESEKVDGEPDGRDEEKLIGVHVGRVDAEMLS